MREVVRRAAAAVCVAVAAVFGVVQINAATTSGPPPTSVAAAINLSASDVGDVVHEHVTLFAKRMVENGVSFGKTCVITDTGLATWVTYATAGTAPGRWVITSMVIVKPSQSAVTGDFQALHKPDFPGCLSSAQGAVHESELSFSLPGNPAAIGWRFTSPSLPLVGPSYTDNSFVAVGRDELYLAAVGPKPLPRAWRLKLLSLILSRARAEPH